MRMHDTLRVLSLTNVLFPGGSSGRILGMTRGFDPERIVHTVVTIQEPTAESAQRFGNALPAFEKAGVCVRTLGIRHPDPGCTLPHLQRLRYSVSALRRSVRRLADLVRELDIDVIDAHNAAANLVGMLAGVRTKRPSTVTEYHIGKHEMMFWPVLGRLTFDTATAVVTDSQVRAADIKTWMYRRRDKVHVIPNGISVPQSTMSREQARAFFRIDKDDTVIAQVSALYPFKGHRVLLEAARFVLDHHPATRFLVIGFTRSDSQEYKRELEERARVLGIADRVRIVGYDGPIGDVFAAADIQAHASLFDSLPNAIIEGMSWGKPAVVTSAGGIPELVLHERTGLVVPPADAVAFGEALLRLIRDPATASRLGVRAYERYATDYTPDVVAGRMERLFRRICGKPVPDGDHHPAT